MSNSERKMSHEWVPDDALNSLAMEQSVRPEETPEAITRRLMRENASVAALSIIHLSKHASTERMRLDASKYVLDRVLGRIGDDLSESNDPLALFLEGVEEYANSAKRQ